MTCIENGVVFCLKYKIKNIQVVDYLSKQDCIHLGIDSNFEGCYYWLSTKYCKFENEIGFKCAKCSQIYPAKFSPLQKFDFGDICYACSLIQ